MNAAAIRDVFSGEDRGPHRDALLLGASLVLEVTGAAAGPGEGVAMAAAALDEGRAARVLDGLRGFGG